eukprot:TRINITY_DN19173_c0_g1_i1.p1 TRINITY_DN19173_c0_g1~~TRINITY_DN19173_c0_g1_i1.p1  ORF type:complete len:193 (-),score=-10.16 TRINITY_DN19173_c0_g1_i1:236-814(-)
MVKADDGRGHRVQWLEFRRGRCRTWFFLFFFFFFFLVLTGYLTQVLTCYFTLLFINNIHFEKLKYIQFPQNNKFAHAYLYQYHSQANIIPTPKLCNLHQQYSHFALNNNPLCQCQIRTSHPRQIHRCQFPAPLKYQIQILLQKDKISNKFKKPMRTNIKIILANPKVSYNQFFLIVLKKVKGIVNSKIKKVD